MPDTAIQPEMPLTVFVVLLLGLATVLFILAAVLPNGRADANSQRFRLMAAGSALWVLYILLRLIGGLVR